MFRDDEGNIDKTTRLRRVGIVVAKNIFDLMEKADGLKGHEDIVADGGRLWELLRKWGKTEDWDKALAGKKVLDIAAGSAFNRDYFSDWHPHFARLCAVNGAVVTVIDRSPQADIDRELFDECLEVNLVSVIMGEGLDHYPPLLNKRFTFFPPSRWEHGYNLFIDC